MKREEHKSRIINKLKTEMNKFYLAAPRTIECIIDEANDYLDSGFVYSDSSDEMLKHREKKHHKQGIAVLVEKLGRKYGAIYSPTIQEIAEQHVKDDMHYIPDEREYSDKYFWAKWSAQHETFFNE